MKRTNKTLVTAAVLTVAATMNAGSLETVSSNTSEAMSAVYGPPVVLAQKGDVNWDDEVNILDYCYMLETANGGGTSPQRNIADGNMDNKIDIRDINALQYYLLGKNPSVTYEAEEMQTNYGCVCATDYDEE